MIVRASGREHRSVCEYGRADVRVYGGAPLAKCLYGFGQMYTPGVADTHHSTDNQRGWM